MNTDFPQSPILFSALRGIWILVIWLASATVLGCTSTPSVTEKGDSIAVLDFQRVIEETRLGEQLKESFESFKKDREVLMELEKQEVQNMYNDLVNQRSVLSESARQQREGEFEQRRQDLMRKGAELDLEIQGKQRELMEEFRSDVERIVSEIAQDRNLGLVIQHGKGTSTLYHRDQFDITDEVIQKINQE